MGWLTVELPIAGRTVGRVAFDHAVILWTDDGGELRLETTFTFIDISGATTSVVPAAAGASASLLIGLLDCNIAGATVGDNGALRVSLDAGTIEVGPDQEFEAWTYAGAKGEKAVCLPGGGLTTWQISI
jgi:hypothetical protein